MTFTCLVTRALAPPCLGGTSGGSRMTRVERAALSSAASSRDLARARDVIARPAELLTALSANHQTQIVLTDYTQHTRSSVEQISAVVDGPARRAASSASCWGYTEVNDQCDKLYSDRCHSKEVPVFDWRRM